MVRFLAAWLLVFAGARFVLAQESEDPAAEAPAADGASQPSAEAVAAHDAFEALVAQWSELVAKLKEIQKQRDAAQGESRAEFDRQLASGKRELDELTIKVGEAGLAVYQADPKAYPRINWQVLKLAEFHIVGDQHGDGGDQFERALPLAKGLIDAGAAEEWPQLYAMGGMAAYCVGDMELAEEYLTKAHEAGLFDNLGDPSMYDAPSVKLVKDAAGYLAALPEHRKNWEAEEKIRDAEAKADDLPRVKLSTTRGDVVIELFENEAPQSVANFITLVKQGFYDGVVFHRVLPLFMAQGGDPEGTGGGGPGYNIRDEQNLPKARRHFRGSLSMANTGQPNSGGSQFFLTFVPTSYLDGRHAVFGRVIEGMDVAASLKRIDPQNDSYRPAPDRIIKAEVLRDRGHAYEFEKLPE